MNLTDILLVIVIVLLLLLFVAIPIYNYMVRLRTRKPSGSGEASNPTAADNPLKDRLDSVETNGHDLSGGSRVEEPAAALESGYRRVDPAHDLPSQQGQPGKKNGKPH